MLFEDEYSELMFIAEDDLESAKILAKHYKPKIEISCYHCQQSAEKSLKAFLSFHNVNFKFIHDLEYLCKDCQVIDLDFSLLLNECKTLNKYITQTRYKRSYMLTEYQMNQAIQYAEKILNFVKEKTIVNSKF